MLGSPTTCWTTGRVHPTTGPCPGGWVFAPGATEMTGEVWLKQDDAEEPEEYFAVEAFVPGEFFTPAGVGAMTH